MLVNYQKYKEACPNSVLTADQLTRNQMEEAIHLHKRHRDVRSKRTLPKPSDEAIERYEAWKKGRAVYSIDTLSEEKQGAVKRAIAEYLTAYPNTEQIYLSGSYASGSWVDETSTNRDRAIRAPFKMHKDASDIDLVPVPWSGDMQVGIVEFTRVPKGARRLFYDKDKKL